MKFTTEQRVLIFVCTNRSASLTRMAEYLGVNYVWLQRVVHTLKEAGYLELVKSGRMKLARFTPQGAEVGLKLLEVKSIIERRSGKSSSQS
jgi:Mn-dependent DtxR family transcriptional regulator